jgi:hypothetical protein
VLEKHEIQQWSFFVVVGEEARARSGYPVAGRLVHLPPRILRTSVRGELSAFGNRSAVSTSAESWI